MSTAPLCAGVTGNGRSAACQVAVGVPRHTVAHGRRASPRAQSKCICGSARLYEPQSRCACTSTRFLTACAPVGSCANVPASKIRIDSMTVNARRRR